MSEDAAPKMIDADRVDPENLIPLWTWLAGLTVIVASYFFGVSQGAPFVPELPVFEANEDVKIHKITAAFLGWTILTPCLFTFYEVTLHWMARQREVGRAEGWRRLPAPSLWRLPASDPVGRLLRTLVWVAVFVWPMWSMGHFARKHLEASYYQQCLDPADMHRCDLYVKDPSDPTSRKVQARRYEGGLASHFSPLHLGAEDYFDHGYRIAEPFGMTYFPGLHAWVWTLLSAMVVWSWLRILWFGGLSGLLVRKSAASSAQAADVSVMPPD